MGDMTTAEVRSVCATLNGRPLSSQGRAVLEALAIAVDSDLSTADVRRRVQRPGVSTAVTRASVSRTLRRLWRAGLVELLTADVARPSFTEQAAYWRGWYTRMQTTPEAHYQAYRRSRQPPAVDDFGCAEAYLEAVRDSAACRSVRVCRVALTAAGRAAVNTRRCLK